MQYLTRLFVVAHRCAPLFFVMLFSLTLSAQPGGGFDPSKMNTGRFYGKIVDENGAGVGYATVKLYGLKMDPQSKKAEFALLAGQLTAENGDFSLEKLPMSGEFTLKISFIGYVELEQKVTFGSGPKQQPAAPGGSFPAMGGAVEKDLGNIVLKPNANTLQEVVVQAEAATATLALDKKIYRVDKDASAAGGNAQDALKNVPSLSVDVDGNVTLRNGPPQIFVDGRPSTLSLDQIPAASIESVEVITNPSAKYDAGGGTAGIVNIVLKKEKRLGYNGNIRTGIDSRLGYNAGGDVNARGEKLNLFLSGNLNRMRVANEAETFRQNLFGDPFTNITQGTDGKMKGYFANLRAGADWLMDNRNTLTFSGSLTRGQFNPEDQLSIRTDSLFVSETTFSQLARTSDVNRRFQNLGGALQFKHLFPKQGAEWTADVNYNYIQSRGDNQFNTTFNGGAQTLEEQKADGQSQMVTFQSDLAYPLQNDWKVETGVRAALRRNVNNNANYRFNPDNNSWERVPSVTDQYQFSDDVYAAYGTLSKSYKKWTAQVGLRAESSFYGGQLTDRDSSFQIVYPISLFPSAFLTYKLSESSSLQLAYTRRVNRPNFFQTMPFVDFTDSLNLRRGNPQLLPEFTNSIELSYQKIFNKNHSLLASAYYKRANQLITAYLTNEYSVDLDREIIISTYANADFSQAYGAEFTLKHTFFKKLDLTTNLNCFYAEVEAGNVENGLNINRLSVLLKEVVQLRLSRGWVLQLNGEYRSRASFTPGNNNDPFRGGHMGGPVNTAQGYTIANWYVDLSVRKDILARKGSLTLSVNDLFATRRSGAYTESGLFIQDTWSIRNPQLVRLNFSYRFGKMDASLFRRKNTRFESQGNDMM